MSIRRLFWWKKSESKMGWFTSARKKECTTLRPWKSKAMSRVPKIRIEDPFAADNTDKGLDLREGVAGKTDTSAPLSTKKGRFKRRQKTERAPSEVVEDDGRRQKRWWV